MVNALVWVAVVFLSVGVSNKVLAASLLDQSMIEGTRALEMVGYSSVCGCDFDGDGLLDCAFGGPQLFNTQPGAVYVSASFDNKHPVSHPD